jgi:hypothetical protein
MNDYIQATEDAIRPVLDSITSHLKLIGYTDDEILEFVTKWVKFYAKEWHRGK